jgi:hypothetical protein
MEFEVPKRHILRPTLFTDTVQRVSQWERQKMCSSRKRARSMADKHYNNQILMNFFVEEKMIKLDSLSKLFFGAYIKNINMFMF